MGEMRNASVNLSAQEVDLIDRLLTEQRFRDEGEVLRYALALLQDWIDEQDESDRLLAENYSVDELKKMWDEGIASGPTLEGNFDPAEIRQRGLARLTQQREAQSRAA